MAAQKKSRVLKRISLTDLQKRSKGWQKINFGTITVEDELLEFHWITPGGQDLTRLASMGGDAIQEAQKTGDLAKIAESLDNSFRAAGVFLSSVLCDKQGTPAYPGGYDEIYEAGFGDAQIAQTYMEMFTYIVERVNVDRKKPQKKG